MQKFMKQIRTTDIILNSDVTSTDSTKQCDMQNGTPKTFTVHLNFVSGHVSTLKPKNSHPPHSPSPQKTKFSNYDSKYSAKNNLSPTAKYQHINVHNSDCYPQRDGK